MAANRQKLEIRLLFKPLLRVVLPVSFVIFVLYKLFNYSTGHQIEISSPNDILLGKIQNFRQREKAKSDPADTEKPRANRTDGSHVAAQQLNALWNWRDSQVEPPDSLFVLIPFNNAGSNVNLQTRFRTCVSSMSELSSVPIVLFVAGDAESRVIAMDIVSGLKKQNVKMHHVDLDKLGEQMKGTVEVMKQHFSHKKHSYYSHSLFYLSIAIHRWAPPSLRRLIMLDADLKFQDDIKRLNELFDRFLPANVLGIAHENQPVYRHVLSTYRQSHPGTRAGEPPPGGLPGFNSGVLLLDIDRMRGSKRYNGLLDSRAVETLSQKYSYRGHLGDQDFYSLVSLENEDLFFVLPCGWNRQLCEWWRENGYGEVFDSYFVCRGRISVYHGNCNTPFPLE